MVRVEIKIKLKHGVEDPEGKNTKKALELLGYSVLSVSVAKTFLIDIDVEKEKAYEVAEDMCRKLLANPVIHEYEIIVR